MIAQRPLRIIFFVFLVKIEAIAQIATIKINGKEIPVLDTSYIHNDSIQKYFFKENAITIWNLRYGIRDLNFDHCSRTIDLLLYIDSSNTLTNVQLISGSNLPKIDSMIISKVKNLSTKFSTVGLENRREKILVFIRFKYFSSYIEKEFERSFNPTTGKYFVFSYIHTHSFMELERLKGEINECSDDLFFYNAGVESYKEKDFKKAIYNFIQALNSNPRDIDATYNLGLAYQKLDKLKKACKCFSEGVEKGDSNSINAFNKYCSEINNKVP